MHEYALVGVPVFDPATCYGVASDHNVNFALVGPVHLPQGSPVAAPGLDLVRAAAGAMPAGDASGTPWFAIGGLTPDRIGEVIKAGARRAGIVVARDSDLAAVTAISTALHQVWDADPDLHDFAFRAQRRRPVTLSPLEPLTGYERRSGQIPERPTTSFRADPSNVSECTVPRSA